MTIWLLAVLILAASAGLGYRQGVIRVAFSLIGIFAAALLAAPVGKLIRLLMVTLGVKNVVFLGILPPLIGFVLVSLAFKAAALPVHLKADVYFKYNAGNLRLALWERLQRRLGLCLGLFNGVAYIILISWVIYALSYWTVQAAHPDGDPMALRVLNRVGKDLYASGFAKVARAVDRVPETYYETADVVGIVYNNPLLEARLSHYPAFLGLTEKPEIQELGNDKTVSDMRQRREPIMNLVNAPSIQKILENKDLLQNIRAIVVANLKDLKGYLLTGKSEKYDPEKILGRWNFDLPYTMIMVHRAQPKLTGNDMLKQRRERQRIYAKTTFVATPEHQAILKDAPLAGTGEWKEALDGKYQVTVSGKDLAAAMEGERLTLRAEGIEMAFLKED
jgi:uncharacterized membrane protein required for colicin V production